jgi:hypothetical protein
MKKKLILTSSLLMITICALSFNYDPNSWTTCITNGVGMNGEIIENNYSCNSFDGFYQGESTILSRCQIGGPGDAGGCSGNSLGYYPSMY